MVSQDVEIINRLGLHAQTAAQLVKLTTQFRSKVFLKKVSSLPMPKQSWMF